MTALCVIGIGSPFGDDQLGWEVVKLLTQRPALQPFIPNQVQLLYCDRPGMHLLEMMRGAQSVFLIDAVKTGASIGTIHHFRNEDITAINDTLSTHGLGVAAAIKMGATLNILPDNVILFGIEIGDVQLKFSHSEAITEAINALAEMIEDEIIACQE